jgi:malate/lactate dehydrogenase
MKIGIVGCGMVGSSVAFALVMYGVGREIILVDLNRSRAEAEANDIFHAVPFAHPLNVRAGDYTDLEGCRVVIIAAGVAQKPGETRLELLQRNAAVRHGDTPLADSERNDIDEKVRRAAYEIIAGKGATYYGIGGAVARLLNVLLHDQRAILTVCSQVQELFGKQKVTLGLPHLVGADGALSRIPLRLDSSEQASLERSAAIIHDAIESLKI